MDFRILLQQFSKNNNLPPLQEENGRYTLFLDGNTVHCYQRNKQAWLEADLGAVADDDSSPDSLNQLLLTRSMGFIRDQRACLSIDQESKHYCLHQRISLSDISPQEFQTEVENFGGCLQYITETIQQFKGGTTSTAQTRGIKA